MQGLHSTGHRRKRWRQKGGPEWNDYHIRLFLRYEPGTAVPRHGVDGIDRGCAHELGLEAVLVLIGSRKEQAGVLPAKIEADAFVPRCSEGLGHRFVELRNSSAVRGEHRDDGDFHTAKYHGFAEGLVRRRLSLTTPA